MFYALPPPLDGLEKLAVKNPAVRDPIICEFIFAQTLTSALSVLLNIFRHVQGLKTNVDKVEHIRQP